MEEYISDNSVYARAKSNSMINPKMIGRVLGVLLFIELGMFLLCAGISLGYGEDDYKYFLYTCVINAVVKIGRMAIVKKTIPNPPIHCVRLRQKSIPCERDSISSSIVAPVVVNPDIVSKKALVMVSMLPLK